MYVGADSVYKIAVIVESHDEGTNRLADVLSKPTDVVDRHADVLDRTVVVL